MTRHPVARQLRTLLWSIAGCLTLLVLAYAGQVYIGQQDRRVLNDLHGQGSILALSMHDAFSSARALTAIGGMSPAEEGAFAAAKAVAVGRTQIDWECELAVVIGKTAARVSSAAASGYIFGYTIENDVSDRGGRGDSRSGSDWLIGKSHDTFAPLGPFIVPKEFVSDPRNIGIRFTLNGETMQQGSTAAMIHDVFEQVQYASHILTLHPGDVIATGTPPGVGSGRKPPIFLKAGDKMACTYEGVGTLRNDVSN